MNRLLPKDPVHGLLYSQVGYEPALPVRVIVRSSDADHLPPDSVCRLIPANGDAPLAAALRPWGALWRSHWWVAEFPAGTAEGTYAVEAIGGGTTRHRGEGLRVRRGVLWDSTWRPMAIEMLERRARFAKVNTGWMDAGCLWQESNAQSAMILGLEDVLEIGSDLIDAAARAEIEHQIAHGSEYLVNTADEAEKLGFPAGALSHDLLGHEKEILPNDAFKAVAAWERALALLPARFDKLTGRIRRASRKTLRWLTTEARPMGAHGYLHRQRGLPLTTVIPEREWLTRDLVMLLWGALAAWRNGDYAAKDLCADTARRILARQIPEAAAEAGFHGHFREFDSLPHSEKAWTHTIVDGQFGADAGGSFPHYLVPLVELLAEFPDHPDAAAWREGLRAFAYGYLLPACRRSPFLILPQGVFGDEGLVWFAGPFHGMSSIYGLTAALAMEFARLFADDAFVAIAYGNLQWLAGLNAGLTADAIGKGCALFTMDIGANEALPVSLIHGVGNRTAGTWFGTRGVICNGFSVGQQFHMDVDPTAENDGPFSFTDEDWIPHSAGWLAGLVRLERYHLRARA